MMIFFKQPNGLFGRFSSVVDTFTHWNLAKEEFYEVLRYYLPGMDYRVEHFDEWIEGGYLFKKDKIDLVGKKLIDELMPINDTVEELMEILTSMGCNEELLAYARRRLEEIDREIKSDE